VHELTKLQVSSNSSVCLPSLRHSVFLGISDQIQVFWNT